MQKAQPFNIAPFNYQGTEKLTTIPPNIIRWVLIELRDAKDSTKIIDRRAALLRMDSVLVDTNLNVGVLFPKAIDKQQYFVMVRYDSMAFLLSKEPVAVPNDNDYNLNRSHRLNGILNSSPLIYTTNWMGFDTLKVCQGESLYLSDSNFVKLGYSFEEQIVSADGINLSITKPHEILFNTDSAGVYQVSMFLNCKEHSIIKSRFVVVVFENPTARIMGPLLLFRRYNHTAIRII